MKICYVGSAQSIHTQRWVRWFADRGHEVHLITDVPSEIDNIKIHLVKGRGSPFNFFIRMFQTRKLVRKIKPEILHAHYVFGYGIFAAFANYHPFIVSPWGSDITDSPERSMMKRWLVEYVLKRADVVSGGNMEGCFKRRLIALKCSEKKIVPLQVASVDTDKFHPSKRSEALRQAIGAENNFLVLSARQLLPQYHVDVLIHTIPLVLKEISNVKFIFLSINEQEQVKRQIHKIIQEYNIKNNVVFIGFVPHSKMAEYLASVDLHVDTFVSLMDTETGDECPGIGTTTLEAMSCATPTLISNKKRIKNCPYISYYPLDSRDLADKVIELLQDEKLRKRIGKESRDFALLMGDENKNMEKWEELYRELLSPKVT